MLLITCPYFEQSSYNFIFDYITNIVYQHYIISEFWLNRFQITKEKTSSSILNEKYKICAYTPIISCILT